MSANADLAAAAPYVLREYALLADGERGILVGPRGDFAWMCFPRWDDDAMFSSLIGVNGSYAINQQPVPKDQLDTQLHAIYDARPAKLLFLKPGQKRIYQDVIEAMDVAKGAGIQIIGFTPKEAYR